MKGVLLSWALTALALLVGAALLEGVRIDGALAALFAALVLGLVNAVIKPILFVLTLPVTILTLGLFYFVLNALMLGLVAWLSPGFTIDGFWPALGLAIVLALLNLVIGKLLKD